MEQNRTKTRNRTEDEQNVKRNSGKVETETRIKKKQIQKPSYTEPNRTGQNSNMRFETEPDLLIKKKEKKSCTNVEINTLSLFSRMDVITALLMTSSAINFSH